MTVESVKRGISGTDINERGIYFVMFPFYVINIEIFAINLISL